MNKTVANESERSTPLIEGKTSIVKEMNGRGNFHTCGIHHSQSHSQLPAKDNHIKYN